MPNIEEPPLIFANLSQQQALEISKQRRDCTVLVGKEVANTGVAGVAPSALMPTHVEIPPSTIIEYDEVAAQIFAFAPSGLNGHWMRLYMLTYRQGGRVFFREHDARTLEAVFRFPST
jgi:hypothetical protein